MVHTGDTYIPALVGLSPKSVTCTSDAACAPRAAAKAVRNLGTSMLIDLRCRTKINTTEGSLHRRDTYGERCHLLRMLYITTFDEVPYVGAARRVFSRFNESRLQLRQLIQILECRDHR